MINLLTLINFTKTLMRLIERKKIRNQKAIKRPRYSKCIFWKCFNENINQTENFRSKRRCIKKSNFEQIKKKDVCQKNFNRFFHCVSIHLIFIMTELWQKYFQKELVILKFDYIFHADAQDLTFLNYDVISQKQIADMNDAESVWNVNVFTSLNSTEQKFKNDDTLLSNLIQKWKFSKKRMYDTIMSKIKLIKSKTV